MLADVEVADWEGIELPLWHFETFAEFDHFMDTMLPVEDAQTAGAWFQATPMPGASGVLFGRDCVHIPGRRPNPVARRSALAIVRIDEDLPQEEQP